MIDIEMVKIQMDASRATISALNEQLATKDAEIARLRQDIVDLNAHVARVEDKLAHATDDGSEGA